MRNNLQEVSYENIGTEITLNNFVTSFEYFNENNTSEKILTYQTNLLILLTMQIIYLFQQEKIKKLI